MMEMMDLWTLLAMMVAVSSGAFIVGLFVGRELGIKETEHKLHVITGKKAREEFRKKTGL